MKWLSTTMGEVCLPTVQTDPTRNGATSFRYVDISGIDRETKAILRAESVPGAEAPSRARKLIRANDVLVSTVRPNLNAVAIVPDDLDGEIASTGFAVLRANPKLANPKYLFYRTQHKEFVDFLVTNATGASYPAVTDAMVRRAPLPLPTTTEQCRIVELLETADALRKLRREADAKAARILPALFLRMFGNPATNPMGWPEIQLGGLADQRPEYGANAGACSPSEGKPRYIRITDIREDGTLADRDIVSLDSEDWNRYLLADGDVLFARSGNTVGKTYIYRPDDGLCAFAGYLIRLQFRSGKTDPWFVFGLTRTAYYRGWVEAHKRVAGQPNINAQEYASLMVPKPPLALQEEFGAIARSIEAIVSQADRASERLEGLFEMMLRQGFSGRLTAQWRRARMKELMTEMEIQAQVLNRPLPQELGATT